MDGKGENERKNKKKQKQRNKTKKFAYQDSILDIFVSDLETATKTKKVIVMRWTTDKAEKQTK